MRWDGLLTGGGERGATKPGGGGALKVDLHVRAVVEGRHDELVHVVRASERMRGAICWLGGRCDGC